MKIITEDSLPRCFKNHPEASGLVYEDDMGNHIGRIAVVSSLRDHRGTLRMVRNRRDHVRRLAGDCGAMARDAGR